MTASGLLDETTAVLGDLIGFATVSSESNLELITYAAERLAGHGARLRISRDEGGQKANLFATLGPEEDGGIVLSGHTDVVPADEPEWTSDPFVMRADGGRLYGRGTADMKGFLAAAIAAAPLFDPERLVRPVHFSLTYDEEVGCFGARQLVDELSREGLRPAAAIIGEPTGMRVIEGHKGCYEYTTEFFGREGHGSNPDAGVNAVSYAVRYIDRLMALQEDLKRRVPAGSGFAPPWTTVQVGRIAGGSARNVIPAHCAVEWEMRPVAPSDASFVKGDLASYCRDVLLPAMRAVTADADIRLTVIGEIDALEPMSENEARAIMIELTGAEGAGLVSFGSEAGLFQSIGTSAVVCGPGSIAQAHKPDEFISLSELERCLAMLERLAAKLTDRPAP